MEFNEYQRAAMVTAIYPERGTGSLQAVAYAVLGLSNEAGEVAGKLKKIMRDSDGVLSDEKKKELSEEVGDVLWYVAAVLDEIGYPMTNVAESNLSKLYDRKTRGVLGGSGDKR